MGQAVNLQHGKLLKGIVVADLGLGLGAALVATYMADNGASVRRIEPAEGDPWYARYPAYKIWRNQTEKRDLAQLDATLAEADLILVGGEPHPDVTTTYDAQALAKKYPKAVVAEIRANPHDTSFDDRPSAEILAQARSGLSFEHFTTRPVYMAFEPSNYGAALQLLVGALGALVERERSGQGQLVRTSLLEGALTWVSQIWTDYERPTPIATVDQPKDPWPLIFQAKDGVYVHIVMGAANTKYATYQALEIDDPNVKPGDSGMPDINAPPKNFYGDWDLLASYVAKLDSQTVLERLWAKGVPAEPSHKPEFCRESEQAKFNELMTTEADGTVRLGSPLIVRVNPTADKAKTLPAGEGPLSGRRVLDFGAFVAGPLATVPISDLGADVIKIEAPVGDPTRAMVRSFTAANRGKRGIAIDMKHPGGLDVAKRLIASADAVANNFRPGVSHKLGIDPASLFAMRPDLVVLESPGYGAEGPLADRGAFDPLMQAFCGHETRAAGRGNPPFWNRTFQVDFTGGMLGAVGLLSAILYHDRSGDGVSLRSPLFNAGAFLLSELIQNPDGSYIGLPELNPGRTGYHPAECYYQCADGWIALVARGEKAVRGLASSLGLGAALSKPVADWFDAEETAISEALIGKTVDEALGLLRGAGVWAELCRTDMATTALHDPELLGRGTVRESQHPQYGRLREIGTLFTMSRSKVGSKRPFHSLGEHTGEILTDLAISGPDIETMRQEKVVS